MVDFGKGRGVGGPRSVTSTVFQNGLRFAGNYDGLGTSRRIYVTDGNGASIPYPAGTIDRLVITAGDPRYTDAGSAEAVIAQANDLPVFDGDASVIDDLLTSGAVSTIALDTEVWFQLWNLDGSYYAIGKIKIVSVGGI